MAMLPAASSTAAMTSGAHSATSSSCPATYVVVNDETRPTALSRPNPEERSWGE